MGTGRKYDEEFKIQALKLAKDHYTPQNRTCQGYINFKVF